MNIFFLKYFYDTIRFGSVTQAAQENHVTKSAISQGITKLESYLGVSLMTHKRNHLKITPEGLKVYDSSRSLFQNIEELKSGLKSIPGEYEGRFSFACSHSLGLSLFSEVIIEYRKRAPKVCIEMLFGHTGLIKNWLKQGKIDLGFVLDNDDLSGLTLKPIYQGAFRIFESNSRSSKKRIESCLFPPARVEVHAVKQAFFERYGYELKTEMEISSWEMIASLISLNQSVGLIPDYMILNSEKSKLIRPSQCDITFPYVLHAALPSREILSKNSNLFITLIKERFQS